MRSGLGFTGFDIGPDRPNTSCFAGKETEMRQHKGLTPRIDIELTALGFWNFKNSSEKALGLH
jgi:hypothetical protein